MNHQGLRMDILRFLYKERENRPGSYTLESKLRSHLGLKHSDMEFELGYLKEKGLVKVNGVELRITADGMDYYEQRAGE